MHTRTAAPEWGDAELSNWIDTQTISDEELLALAEQTMGAMAPGVMELAEIEGEEDPITFEFIAEHSDEELAEFYGFEDDDIALLRLQEDAEKELDDADWLLSSLARIHMHLVNQTHDFRPKNTAKPSRTMPSLDWSPKQNWVDRKGIRNAASSDGSLPMYITRLAKQFTYAKKFTRAKAIQWAVGIARRWCLTGFVRPNGKGQLNAGSRGQACAAIKQWEQMKARAG